MESVRVRKIIDELEPWELVEQRVKIQHPNLIGIAGELLGVRLTWLVHAIGERLQLGNLFIGAQGGEADANPDDRQAFEPRPRTSVRCEKPQSQRRAGPRPGFRAGRAAGDEHPGRVMGGGAMPAGRPAERGVAHLAHKRRQSEPAPCAR